VEQALLQYGLPGIVILAQFWVIKRLYSDLETAREDLDDARLDTIRTLSELATESRSRPCERDSD
jgi:hypothetical protein